MARKKVAAEDRSRKILLQSQAIRMLPILYSNTFELLKKQGKTAEEMYSSCGLSVNQGTNLWSGKSRFDFATVVGMSDFLGVNPHELLMPKKEVKK